MKNCFRPHQGIILFNSNDKAIESLHKFIDCFRPHQGIILFNKSSGSNALYSSAIYLVSVPIRGLFYLTQRVAVNACVTD